MEAQRFNSRLGRDDKLPRCQITFGECSARINALPPYFEGTFRGKNKWLRWFSRRLPFRIAPAEPFFDMVPALQRVVAREGMSLFQCVGF
jgi:hypothetical protein